MALMEDRISVSLDKLLVATDFSPASEKVVLYAKALAQRFGSIVEVAHIFDPSVVCSYEDAIIGMLPGDRREVEQRALESVIDDFTASGIRAEIALAEGHRPFAFLLKLAREKDVDLIVAGTASKSGVARLILGSTAEELIRNAEIPVLTIGPKVQLPEAGALVFKKIIYATDFSEESLRAAAYALSFAQDSGAHLYFCYVLGMEVDSIERRKFLEDGFKSALQRMIPPSSYDWCSPECVVEHGAAADAILGLATKVQADLIVLGARKASFWLTHIVHGLTPDLLAQATCPVMTVS
jgi:nucleotide-binding universal stress UspA family protein